MRTLKQNNNLFHHKSLSYYIGYHARLTFNKCISVNHLIRLVTYYYTFYVHMVLFRRNTLQSTNPYLEYQLQFKSFSVKSIEIDSIYVNKETR